MFDDGVIAVWKRMTTIFAVKRWGEAMNVDGLPYVPAMPVWVASKDFYVRVSKMMLSIGRMLHDG